MNTSGFCVAGWGVETEAGAESLGSVALTVVLKLEPVSELPGEFVKRLISGPDFSRLPDPVDRA